jgi:hypothetical protein
MSIDEYQSRRQRNEPNSIYDNYQKKNYLQNIEKMMKYIWRQICKDHKSILHQII